MIKYLQFFILSSLFLVFTDFNSFGKPSNYKINSSPFENSVTNLSFNTFSSFEFKTSSTKVSFVDTLVPAACYNFISDFDNSNGEMGVEPITPKGGTGTFFETEDLCSNSNIKQYSMSADQGIEVDNGSLLDQSNYTIELLFKVDGIPLSNTGGRVFIMNFFNQNNGGLFINPDGYLCFYPNTGTETCGVDLVSSDYPVELNSDWINIAVSFGNGELNVYLNGDLQFTLNGTEFSLPNNTSYFDPPDIIDDIPIADITIDYLRYFDEVLEATTIKSLNLAAVSGNNIEILPSATEGCIGDELTMTASGEERSFYIWSTGDITNTNILNYTISQETDTLWVQGVSISPCDRECFDIADTIVISGFSYPEMDIVAPTEICEGDLTLFSATEDPAGGLTQYFWSTTGSTSNESGANTKDYTITFDADGIVDVNLQIINENGCVGDTTFQLVVNNVPTPDVNIPSTACEYQTVNVEYTGDASPSAIFSWDFDGATSVIENEQGRNFDVIWADLGFKTISLSISDESCTVLYTYNIEVLPVPTTDLNVPTSVCSGQVATFEYTGTADASADLVWTLDGGTVSNVVDPDRQFDVIWATSGEKTITLNINQNGCDTDTTFTVDVGKTPAPEFDLPAGACMDEDVVVLYTGTADLSLSSPELEFDWDWGVDGSAVKKSGGQEAYDVQWSSFGTKTVTLQVTENGCTSTLLSQTIEVAEKPVISFNPPIPASICIAETVPFVFNGTTGANGTFSWDFDGGTQTNVVDAETDFELEWDSAGTKNVTLSIDNDGCVTTETFTIDVLIPATANVSFPDYACAGEAARIIYTGSGDTNDPGTTFNWTFEDADAIVDLGNEVYDVTWDTYDPADTIKTITLEIIKDGCTVIRNFTISISPKSVPQITAPTEACLDESISVTFDSDLAGASLTGYDFGTDGTETATADPEVWNVAWSSTGTKIISATYSINGCDSTITHDIEIFPIPSDNMDTETQICDNGTANFTYRGAGTPSITWTMPAGVTFTQVSGNNRDIEITFPVTGTTATYTIEAVISNGNCDITFQEDITVLPAPIANIPNLGTICTTEPVTVDISADFDSNNAYTWELNGGTIDNYNGAGIWTKSWGNPGPVDLILRVQSPNGCVSRDTAALDIGYLPQLGELDVPAIACENESFQIEYLGNAAEVRNFTWTEQAGGTFNFDGTDSWTVEFDSPGEKEVTLSMTGGAGCSVDTTFTINVNFHPDFDISSNNTCTNIAVFVTYPDVLGADIDTTWTFGDGAIFEQINDTTYSIEYETPGTKTISLTIDGNCGQEIQTSDVEVSEGPDYSINAAAQVCFNDPDPYEIRLVEAVDTDVEIIGFELIPADDNATATISADGLRLFIDGWDYGGYKQAILDVSDITGSGCPDKFETIDYAVYNFIELNAIPDNGNIGETINISFSGLVEDDATFSWDFDGATVNEITENEEYELTWATSGSKMVGLEIVGQCSISDSLAINISDPELDSTATDILSFELPNATVPAIIDTVNHTIEIEVDGLSDLTNMTPQIQISEGATISPDSNISRDFSEPVVYTVTAEDGVTSQLWEVTVNTSTIIKEDQEINFEIPAFLCQDQSPFPLEATSSSGLQVQFAVDSGSASILNNQLFLTSASTIIIKAYQEGNDTLNYVEVKKLVSVSGAYDVTVNVLRPDESPLEEGLGKLFDIDGGLYKRMKFTDGNLMFKDVCDGEYILQIIPTGNATADVSPTYFERTHFNKDAAKLNIFNNINLNMVMKDKSGNSDDKSSYGQIKGKIINSEDSSQARLSIGEIRTGEGLKDMIVYLINLETSDLIRSTVTDSLGKFEMTEIANGNYKFMIDIPGLDQASTSFELPYEAQDMDINLTIYLNSEGIESVDVNTILANETPDLSIQVFPNPTNDFLYIIGNLRAFQKVSVFNSEGKNIKTVTLMKEDINRIDLFDLSNGIYYLCFDENKNNIIRVVKN